MDTGQVDVLSRHPVPRHRLTVKDYHRLGEAGILGEDDRVELLEGQLVDMSPIGPRHALAIDALTELLVTTVARRASVRVQNPIVLDDESEPQPDFAVVRRPWRGYPDQHPQPEDVLLLIEVSDSSLDTDKGAKLALYARAGVREFWIVDLTTNKVIVHRDPDGECYKDVKDVEGSGALDIQALPSVNILVASIFS
ncbi:MAG TPA: Uma2 family endonuclease [Acetobacteraceae bacterium]|nr:Uma2 family endonuclease [Acetobacteraceae bacterium]